MRSLRFATLFFLLCSPFLLFGQTVGVVFSGGGANGLAHVGVLKALESNSIPIDYIAGTSIGAMVGALYASGYSPEQIEFLLTSKEFQEMARGAIKEEYIYYFRKPTPDASWIEIKFSSDSTFLETSIPTSVINPVALDLELMKILDPPSAAANYDFDQLFIPFRCVAADIENKKTVVFDKGNVNKAVRASMSYPLYLQPLTLDGKLLFDGGLYNNFPTDVMRDEFDPEVIIGSNVSSNEAPPRQDDFLSQLRNMVVSKTNYELIGDCCVLIEPEMNGGTFSFDNLQSKVDSGYTATMRKMPIIKDKVHRRVHKKVVNEKRQEFQKKMPELKFSDYRFEGITTTQANYIRKIIRPQRDTTTSYEDLQNGYYRVAENDKIKGLYPYATLLPDSTYLLNLNIRKEKDLTLEFGGNIASRPITTGFIGVGYDVLNRTGISLYANSYFGRLYSSVLGKARFDIPIRFPIYIEPEIVINRWNYFRSRATFFEDNNSLFLIQNERFGKINTSFALSNKTRFTLGAGIISLKDDYYQSRDFGQDDVTDNTLLAGSTASLRFEKNSLNDKLYPNRGTALSASIRVTEAEETYNPGTTSDEQLVRRRIHDWVDLNLKYDSYYKQSGTLRLGVYLEAHYSDLELFLNYTASALRSPAFQPTPESQTLFLESFRAYQYVALGHKVIINVTKNVDLRLEGYIFQPYRFVTRDDISLEPIENENWERRYTIATANAVYKSPLGPVSFAMNYYYNVPEISVDDRTPLTFLFHFGYILFNDKALK